MAEQTFDILTGVYKDESPLKAEGYVINTQGMRIWRDGWQTQGGYEVATVDTFSGYVRGAAAWADLSAIKTAGFGTAANIYAFYGGAIDTITPKKAKGTAVNPFTTVSGDATITARFQDGSSNDILHGLKVDDSITFSLGDAVGGLTLNGTYTVTAILDIYRFTFEAGSNASSSATGGGKVEYEADLDTGLVDGTGGVGYGTSTWGAGSYGTLPTSGDIHARMWSVAPWGQNALFAAEGTALFEWQPRVSYDEHVTNGDFAASDGWTAGTGWSIGSGVATASAGTGSDLEQDLTGILSGGVTYELTMTVTRSAGALQVNVTSDVGPTDYAIGESIEKAGTYTRRFTAPPSPTTLKFSKDSSFAGTLDDVSIKVVSPAYRIQSAPPYCDGVMVTAENIAVVWSTVRADGVFDERCVRWSDLGDNKTWLSATDNYAGENSDFGVGSRVVRVISTRAENLVFTDAGVYSMTYTGTVGDAFAFELIGGGAGLKAKNAVAEFAGNVFWWGSDDQFYIYQGATAQILECPVRRDAVDNLAAGQENKITFSIQSKFNEVRMNYPDARDDSGVNLEQSRAIVFNWVENKWYNDTDTRTQYIGTSVFNDIIGFGQDGNIYYTDIGTSANGNTLTSELETGWFDIGDGHNMMALKRFIPDFDDQAGDISLYLTTRRYARSTETTYGPYSITASTAKIDFRHKAGQFKLKLAGSSTDLFHRFGAFRMDVKQTGARH